MKYILLMYHTDHDFCGNEHSEAMDSAIQTCHDLHAKGQYVSAAPLQGKETAKTVRVRDGKQVVTDGPYVETKEHLGGYVLIDVDNLDEAIAIAAKFPAAKVCKLEIRPLLESAAIGL